MCGSATLAIVVSTPCMIGASMIEIVIAPRLATATGVSPLTAPPLASLGRRATRTAARSSVWSQVALRYRKHGFPRELLPDGRRGHVVTMGMPALIYGCYFRIHGYANSDEVSSDLPGGARPRNPAGDDRSGERCEAAGLTRPDERLRRRLI